MKKGISLIDLDIILTSNGKKYYISTFTCCPFCNKELVLEPLIGCIHKENSFDNFGAVLFCDSCQRFVFVSGRANDFNLSTNNLKFYPSRQPQGQFHDSFKREFPDFVEIYNQALSAEAFGLDKICGMGYRKALEFLIKDFAIKFHNDQRDEIESLFLSKCIDRYIENSRIKTLAKASAWLGNDETHYIRRNSEYGIAEIKSFISACVSFIESELEYLKAKSIIDGTTTQIHQ